MLSQPTYQPGERIGGRYLIHKAMMGGMGEVYLCLDEQTITPFALKTFQPRFNTPALKQIFFDEVGHWVSLEKHPNIVRCFYMDSIDNQPFMFLEWVVGDKSRGVSLRDWLRHGPLELKTALDFTIDICRGLIHAQAKVPGMVHRDLKPDNVLVDQTRRAKITDFGLAAATRRANIATAPADEASDVRHSLRGAKGIVGTPLYMPPEQWRGDMDVDTRADIYAIGCMLYELLTGQWPFMAQTVRELEQMHLNAPLPSMPDSSPAARVVEHCLSKAREDRYADMASLLTVLEAVYNAYVGTPPQAAPAADQFAAADYHNRGVTYDALGRNEAALTDFDRALELDPNFALAYSNRAATHCTLRRYEAALTDCNRAIALDLNLASAYNNRGRVYYDLGQYDRALADFNEAIHLDPYDVRAYNNRGGTYHALQRYVEASADLTHTIELDRKYADAWFNRGRLYETLRQYDGALADYTEAIHLDPTHAKAYANRGHIYRLMGQYLDALADHTKAIALDPNDALAYDNRGFAYYKMGHYTEALTDFHRAVELDPNFAQAYNNRGLVYGALGQHKVALTDFDQAIHLDPAHAQAYNNRGAMYFTLGDYAKAEVELTQAITLNPADAEAYSNRGLTYHELKEDKRALGDCTQAINLDPGSANAWFNRGVISGDLGENRSALEDYAQSITLNPNFINAYLNRGTIYYALGEYVEALADFTHAINLDRNLAAYHNRGVIYHKLRQYDQALADYTQIIVLDPGDALAYYKRGGTYRALQRYEEALTDFEKAAGLGLAKGAELATQVREELGIVPAPQADSAQQAFEAFQRAGSLGEMQQSVQRFPLMTDSGFIQAVEQAINQQVLPEHRPAFQQRLEWLRQIATERK